MSRDGANVRVRKGTKATQGINQDVAVHSRVSDAAANVVSLTGPMSPCPYPEHRRSDWRLAGGGPITCGICHTPPPSLNVVTRADRSTSA